MRSATIQIGERGSVTLPAKIRTKYGLGKGENLTVVDLDGCLLLAPRVPVVSRLAAEIERMRRAAGLEISDLLTSGRVVRAKRGGSGRRS